jgi:hypothetical protein
MAKKTQLQKFRESARAVETDDSEDQFNSVLKGLTKNRRQAKTLEGKTLPTNNEDDSSGS